MRTAHTIYCPAPGQSARRPIRRHSGANGRSGWLFGLVNRTGTDETDQVDYSGIGNGNSVGSLAKINGEEQRRLQEQLQLQEQQQLQDQLPDNGSVGSTDQLDDGGDRNC
jgi:hypothetical protein